MNIAFIILLVIEMNDNFPRYWEDIGFNIAYYRKKKKLRQQDLADMSNISRTHLQRIETGHSASLDTLFCIAEALGIEAYKLFMFDD